MSPYENRPWLQYYDAAMSADFTQGFDDVLSLFRDTVRRLPEAAAILYFGSVLTFAEVDRLSDALAAELAERGFSAGDRLAIYLQNTPHFLICLLAAWKLSGIAVTINPMNRAREVSLLLNDCTASALVCEDVLFEEVIGRLDPSVHRPGIILQTTAADFLMRPEPRIFSDAALRRDPTEHDFLAAIRRQQGRAPVGGPAIRAQDTALLVYTSGTTGEPKAAMITHANAVFNAAVNASWQRLQPGRPMLGMSPLFHITGLVYQLVSVLAGIPLILSYRFDPDVTLAAIDEHRPGFTVGSITFFVALLNRPEATRERFACFSSLLSGGAAVPPAVVRQFQDKLGLYIRNGYGLTETTSAVILTPLGQEAPVDPQSGALSIGIPCSGATCRICDDDGQEVPVGALGELVVEGPAVMAGYWNKPEETGKAIRNGRHYTGDVGFMDQDGWFYVVDRKKDMINAAGYKVWPREIEDVLYEHPAIREAAVVGVADAYRGETVKAVISLRAGLQVTPEEIMAFCKERMAAYKYPRSVVIMPELPKTASGKILRRELRD